METKVTKNIKTKTREKCGNCYYNGSCIIKISSCPYLKKTKTVEETN